MIRPTDGKIGAREFTSLLLLMIAIKLSDTTPSILFLKGQNAAWLITMLSAVLMVIPFILLFSLLRKYEGKGLMELIQQTMGSYIGFGMGLILFLYMLFFAALNSRSYVDIINVMMYQRTPIPVLYLMLLFVSWYVANRGFESIGRTAWTVIPYIKVTLWSLIVLVWEDVDWLHLYPIAGPGFSKIAHESVLHCALFSEVILIATLAPYVRGYKTFRLSAWIGFIVSCIELVLLMAVYVAVFDYPNVVQMAYPFQHLTRAASIGQTITHVESIFFGFWIISSAIHFAAMVYLTSVIFAKTMRVKQYKPLLMPMTWLILLLGMLPPHTQATMIIREYLTEFSSLLFLILPVVLWGLDRMRGNAA
jgi:spore germination protein KB